MNHRHLDVWNPNDALPQPFPILSSDYALPEKLITHLAFWLGFMEKLAKTFGNLAFIWAIVILLGGFVSVLAVIDFWFITIILVIEGIRILSYSRVLKWQYDLAAEVTFGHPRFLKNIIHLFHWLQNISVILCMTLSLIRLLQKDIKSQGGKNQDSALLLFYTLVMIESIILILENSYYFWKIHDDKLFQQICNECGLIFDDAYSLRLFFYDAYSKCISGSIIDVLKMNLISFAKNCLDSRFIKKQIIGARILGQFIKNERLADDTLRRIGNSTQTIERLIEMLNWKNPNEYEIRFFATLIVSKMVSRQYYALKVIEIPGAMESIRSLFAFVEKPYSDDFNQFGLLILKRLTKDYSICLKIASCPELIAHIIKLTSLKAELLSFDKPNLQINMWCCAFQIVKRLTSVTEDAGEILRRNISRSAYFISNIRDMLMNTQNEHKLNKIMMKVLQNLALDNEINGKIIATGSMLFLICRLVFYDMTLIIGEETISKIMTMRNEAATTLILLIHDNKRAFQELLTEKKDVMEQMGYLLDCTNLRLNGMRIMSYFYSFLSQKHNLKFSATLKMILNFIMFDEDEEHWEASIELLYQMLKQENGNCMVHLKEMVSDEDLAKRLMNILFRYKSPSMKVPKIRRLLIQLSVILMMHEQNYIKLFQRYDMINILKEILETTSELDCFMFFAGGVGFHRCKKMFADVADDAMKLFI